jgi:hypothetical protein
MHYITVHVRMSHKHINSLTAQDCYARGMIQAAGHRPLPEEAEVHSQDESM